MRIRFKLHEFFIQYPWITLMRVPYIWRPFPLSMRLCYYSAASQYLHSATTLLVPWDAINLLPRRMVFHDGTGQIQSSAVGLIHYLTRLNTEGTRLRDLLTGGNSPSIHGHAARTYREAELTMACKCPALTLTSQRYWGGPWLVSG